MSCETPYRSVLLAEWNPAADPDLCINVVCMGCRREREQTESEEDEEARENLRFEEEEKWIAEEVEKQVRDYVSVCNLH